LYGGEFLFSFIGKGRNQVGKERTVPDYRNHVSAKSRVHGKDQKDTESRGGGTGPNVGKLSWERSKSKVILKKKPPFLDEGGRILNGSFRGVIKYSRGLGNVDSRGWLS